MFLWLTLASGVATNSPLSFNDTDVNSTFASTGAPTEYLFSAIYTAASPKMSTSTAGSTKSASTTEVSALTTASTDAGVDSTSASVTTAASDTTIFTNEPTSSTAKTTINSIVTTDPTIDSTTAAVDPPSTNSGFISIEPVTTDVTTSVSATSVESTPVTSVTSNKIPTTSATPTISDTTNGDMVLVEEYANILTRLVESEGFLFQIQSEGSLAQITSIELIGNLTIIAEGSSPSGRAEAEAVCKLVGISVENFGEPEQDAFIKVIAQDVGVEENQVVINSISVVTSNRKLLSMRVLNEAGIIVEFSISVPESSPTVSSTSTVVTHDPTGNIQLTHALSDGVIAIIVIFGLLTVAALVVVVVIIHRKKSADKEKVSQGKMNHDIEAPKIETSLHDGYLSAEAVSTSPKGLQLKPLRSITYSPLNQDQAMAKLVSSHPNTTKDEEEMVVRSFSSIHSP